jgi:predicted GIY-YIG superfamily endonuclease
MPKGGKKITFILYMLTFPNSKIYFGITSCGFKKRMREHKHKVNSTDSTKLGRAIKKYGWDSVNKKVLHENLSATNAYELEKLYIKDYKTTDDRFGYNLCIGGRTNVGYKHPNVTVYTKEQIKERAKKCSDTKKKNASFYRAISSDNATIYSVVAKNTITNEVIEFKNASVCENALGYRRGRVYDHIMRESKLLDKQWVIRRN